MDEGKRYFWLKLKDDFFTSKRIKKLRRLAGGDTYTIIYLKLQLLSIKTEGILTYTGLESSMAEELALDIDERPEDVKITLAYLQSCGLIETSDEINFFLPYVIDNTGSETASAQRSREYRARQKVLQCGCNEVALQQACNKNEQKPNVEIEIEKEIEIEIDIEKEIETELDNKSTKEIGIGCGEGEETSLPSPPEPQAEAKPKPKSKPKDVQNIELYSKIDVIPLYGFSEVLYAKIAEWLTYKGQNGETYKEVGLKALLSQIRKNCDSYGESAVLNLIDECMAASYKGIIFDRLKKPRGAPKDSHEAYVEKWRNI